MFGKYITLKTENCEIKVFVFCTPTTSKEELEAKAYAILRNEMEQILGD